MRRARSTRSSCASCTSGCAIRRRGSRRPPSAGPAAAAPAGENLRFACIDETPLVMHENAAGAGNVAARLPKIPESVLVVIHTPALDVLLLERADHPDFWQSVTGSRDTPDEPLTETAAREVAEETGIVVGGAGVPRSALREWGLRNVYEIYPVWRHRYAAGVTHNTEHVFGLAVPAGTAVTLSEREHRRYLWLPWHEAADRCFSPSNAEAVLQLPRFVVPPCEPSR